MTNLIIQFTFPWVTLGIFMITYVSLWGGVSTYSKAKCIKLRNNTQICIYVLHATILYCFDEKTYQRLTKILDFTPSYEYQKLRCYFSNFLCCHLRLRLEWQRRVTLHILFMAHSLPFMCTGQGQFRCKNHEYVNYSCSSKNL